MACNCKEYYELFENSFLSKENKGTKKASPGISFENYADRLVSLTNFDTFEKPPANYKDVSRLTDFQGEMQKKKRPQKLKFHNLLIKDFVFLIELPPCPSLILI